MYFFSFRVSQLRGHFDIVHTHFLIQAKFSEAWQISCQRKKKMLSMKFCQWSCVFFLLLLDFVVVIVLSIQHSTHWVRLIFAPPLVIADSRRAVTLEDPCLDTICVSGPGAPRSPSREPANVNALPAAAAWTRTSNLRDFFLRDPRMFISHSHLTRLWAGRLSLSRRPHPSKSSACQFQRRPQGGFQCKGIGIRATQIQPQKSWWQQFGKWLQMYCRPSKSTFLWRKC